MKFFLKDWFNLIIASLGVILQGIHTYFLFRLIAPESELWLLITEAILAGAFLSFGLILFTVKSNLVADYNLQNKYKDIATWFAVFEAFVNILYWAGAIIIIPIFVKKITDYNIYILVYKSIGGILFGIMIPVTIKSFAGERAKNLTIFKNKEVELQEEINQLKEQLNSIVNSDKYTMKILQDFNEDEGVYPSVELKRLN